MQSTHLNERYLEKILPTMAGDKKTWKFTSVLRATNFWSQILLSVVHKTKAEVTFSYSPHLWFEWIVQGPETQYRDAYLDLTKQFIMVGSRSFLDRHMVENLSPDHPNEERYLAHESERVIQNQSTHLDIVDDYVLTVKLGKKFTTELEKLYASAHSEEEIDGHTLYKTFSGTKNIKLVLEKDGAKAEKYRRKFKKIFGILK